MTKWPWPGGFGASDPLVPDAQADPRGPWYYCLAHHGVETLEGCKAADRLGPYRLRVDAEHALDRVAARNQEWDSDPFDDGPE
jgi:hypothetical protein